MSQKTLEIYKAELRALEASFDEMRKLFVTEREGRLKAERERDAIAENALVFFGKDACQRHSGSNTPPFHEFVARIKGCHLCQLEERDAALARVKAFEDGLAIEVRPGVIGEAARLQAECDRLRARCEALEEFRKP